MSALEIMGEEERTQYEKVRDAKSRLYGHKEVPEGSTVKPYAPTIFRSTYIYQRRYGDEPWAIAMRRSDPRSAKRIFVDDVLRATCRHYQIRRIDIISDRRFRSIVWPRQVAMYVAREVTEASLPEIGRHFGNRDHTTVLNALRKVTSRIDEDVVRHDIFSIKKSLGRAL